MRTVVLRRPVRDAALAVLLSAALVLELALNQTSPATALQYALGLATTAPFAVSWRWPVAVGLLVQLVFAITPLLVVPPDSFTQGLAVFVLATYVAALGARSWRESLWCGAGSITLLALQGYWDPRYVGAGAVIANTVYGVLVWSVAAAVRVHADRSARSALSAEAAVVGAQRLAEEAVLAERSRIARELHDVVAHALSIVVMRARGGIHEQAVDPDAGTRALRDVDLVASRALSDMRRLLDLVHDQPGPDGHLEPQPSLQDLPDLFERIAAAGVRPQLEVRGDPQQLSPGLELSAYRVVQESLTNIMRHSAAHTAAVTLTWSVEELQIQVIDDGPADIQPGTGAGLTGLRERVELFGGTLHAGPRSPGGFVVDARLPVQL